MSVQKRIVFDWNGCLLDDFIVALTAMNRILKANGRDEVDAETYRERFNMPLDKLWPLYNFYSPPENSFKIYNDTVNELAPKVSLRDNLKDILSAAKENDVECIIASNSRCEIILDVLRKNGLDIYFKEVIGSDYPQYDGKNKLENYARYATDNPAEESIFIGDTFEEIDMAKAAKGISVAITGGYISAMRLMLKQPNHLVDSLLGFQGILNDRGYFSNKGPTVS